MRRALPVLWLVLALTACAPAPRGTADPSCSRTVTEAGDLTAVDDAGPGDVVCLRGQALGAADVVITRSGAPGRPLVLDGGGTTVASVRVQADDVTVRGVRTTGGGIDVQGRRVAVTDNQVEDASDDGITCTDCRDVTFERNTVERADGSGMRLSGTGITASGNTVRGSVRRLANDADGIRFFGSGIRLLDNEVADISARGYGADAPHTDCFQTYDNGAGPTTDVVIAGNHCRNVDVQCLIATAEEAGTSGRLGRSHGIEFTGNTCEVGGAQAVLVQWFPDVHVRDNTLAATDRGAYFGNGSTGGEFVRNTVRARETYQVDESSRAGFRDEGNTLS